MIKIDKTDSLYKYLQNLNVEDIDNVYLELAKNGRYKTDDVRQYFREMFEPSQTEEFEEKHLEEILDYYVDIKKAPKIKVQDLKHKIKEYKATKDRKIRENIINSQLKDVLYLCVNYSTRHKDVDLQDLIQVANLGLIEAVEKCDPDVKIEFKDYVVYYVGQAIKDNFKEKTNG